MKIHLCRYFGSHAYESLRDKKLMLTNPRKLNDPFEFLYKTTGQITMPKARQFIKRQNKSDVFYIEAKKTHPHINNKKYFKKIMREKLEELAKNYFDQYDSINEPNPDFCKQLAEDNFRIACFSSTDVLPHEEILMWSHYAAKHTGVRIKFLLDDAIKYPYFLKKVIYKKERAGIDLTEKTASKKMKDELIELIRTKSEGWSYEKEYRMFCLPSLCLKETGSDGVLRSFLSFDPNIVSQIDFGLDCPKSEIERISNLARTEYSHAELRKATYHKSEYAIEYRKI